MDTEPLSVSRTLYRMTEVRVAPREGPALGPITWTLARGRRFGVRCAEPGQWETLLLLLTRQVQLRSGVMEEVAPVIVQTDRHLREGQDLNQTIGDFLHSPDTPETVWLNGRRRSVGVLVDILGISPRDTRRAVKLDAPRLPDKLWALRFALSEAGLLLGREVFALPDAEIREGLRQRWPDWPGTVVAAEGGAPLPGEVDAWVAFDPSGALRHLEGAG